MTDLLAEAVAALYDADPDEFMPRRQELADAAREAGDQDAAKQITGLRKPTRSAWVVNRLVRADPEVTIRLAALSTELRARRPRRHQDQGADRRPRAAGRRAHPAGPGRRPPAPPAGQREEVTATLDAAIADPEVAASLGTLVRAAHWAGFGLAPLPDGEAPPVPPRKPEPAEAVATHERRRQEKIEFCRTGRG